MDASSLLSLSMWWWLLLTLLVLLLWVRMWRCMLPLVVNETLQMRHLKGRSPECTSMCLSSELDELSSLPQMLQPNALLLFRFSGVDADEEEDDEASLWLLMCRVNSCWCSNTVSHTGHTYLTLSSSPSLPPSLQLASATTSAGRSVEAWRDHKKIGGWKIWYTRYFALFHPKA